MRRVWLLLAAIGVGAAACSQGAFPGSGEGPGGAESAPQAQDVEPAPGEISAQGLPSLSPTIVRTANLGVLVTRDGFARAVDRATAVAAANGGFIVESSIVGHEARSGSMVLRVPADRFDAALTELRRLGRVREERISTQDVGEELVDLEARSRNLAAQERVMLDLMADARTVAATIQVQHELEDIQLEIERIEGRLRFLEDQVALGTITLHLAEEGQAPPESPGILANAWSAAADGFLRVVAAAVVAAGYLGPFALAAGLSLLVWLRVRRRAGPAA